MSTKGSAYARFKRALGTGNLALVHAAAAELPRVELVDALSICLLLSAHDHARFERAAVRWLARLALERPGVRLEDLRAGLVAFQALPHNPVAARRSLAELCAAHDLARAVPVLTLHEVHRGTA